MITYQEYLDLKENILKISKGKRRNIHSGIFEVCVPKDEKFSVVLKKCESINITFSPYNDEIQLNFSENMEWAELEVCSGSEDTWLSFLMKCENLRYLSIDDEELVIDDRIFGFKDLICLQLENTDVNPYMDKIYELKFLEILILDNTNIVSLSKKIGDMTRLKYLSLMYTPIKELPEELKNLWGLEYLGLNGTKILKIPSVVYELKQLKSLYLGRTKICELSEELQELKELEYLAIWETDIKHLPDWVCDFENLKGLFLGRVQIENLPEQIGKLNNLEQLYIDGTKITELPDSFGELDKLEDIMLNNTQISTFPKMKKMDNLRRCNLSNMELERIPREFLNPNISIQFDGRYDEGIILDSTRLLCQPISLFEHEKDFIDAYYEEEKIHLNETKIVFLGDGEGGKTHIIERIKENGIVLEKLKEEATPGIAISQKMCDVDSECVNLQIWDFGGQEIMHSMHRFFLTERTLYVIVVNARDNTQDERAKYWLNNVKSFANGCPVLIVLNKMDQNPSASLNERLLRNDYPQIVGMIKMSALNDSKDDFEKFQQMILQEIRKFDSYGMEFPVSWNKIKSILSEMEENYIVDSKYREICNENGVYDEKIQNWLLDWFHDLGISFNYHKKDQLLSAYMVLKPNWITNAIYIIIFNGVGKAKNGIICISDIIDLLKNPVKAVEDIKYNIEEVPYILGVMRRFEISYSIDVNQEFIPMMCDRNQHEDAEKFITDDCLEYFMEYEYLPNNVLHKLMIKMRSDLDEEKIWLTGMILKARDNNISALVRMHDKKIEIFVKSQCPDIYPAREYLTEIREYLIKINQELNLCGEDTLVYKEDGISEEIKYNTLLIHLSAGQKGYFSTVFRKTIDIKKILGLVENEIDISMIIKYCTENSDISFSAVHNMLMKNQAKEILYNMFEDDLIECCTKLQGNTLQIQAGNENDRNTYLRDLLTVNKKYIICDQTLNGLSANGKAAGELDLLVKTYKHQPLAILEALNLESIDSNKLSTHISKLFSYDTWGLEKNYIVVYAETKGFSAFCNRFKEYIKNYEYPYLYIDTEEIKSYTDICIFETILERNEKVTKIVYVIVKV